MGKRKGRKQRSDKGTAKTRKKQTLPQAAVEKQRKKPDKEQPVRHPRPRVPPPDSKLWPQEYRGARWRPAYAYLFAGKCQLCAYSCPQSKWRQAMDRCRGLPRLLLCTNHPDSPGELHGRNAYLNFPEDYRD